MNNTQGIVSVGEPSSATTSIPDFEVGEKSIMKVYPNPSRSGFINVEFELEAASNYSISIININGAAVSPTGATNGQGSAGINSVRLDNSNLAPGFYFVRLDTNRGTFVQKFVVSR